MSGYDSDEPPALVYSSESDMEYDQPPESKFHSAQWTRQLEQIIKIRTLAPFVFDTSFGSEMWKGLIVDSGLLMEHWLKSEQTNMPTLLKRVELMEHFTDCVIHVMRSHRKRQLAFNLFNNLKCVLIIKRVLPVVSEHQLIDRIRGYIKKFPPDEDKDKVTLGVLYACYQYVEVLKELKHCDYVKQFGRIIYEQNKGYEEATEKEETKNDIVHDLEMIKLYSDALRKSHFSYELYLRRARVYLTHVDNAWLALMDAKRALILNEQCPEGHYLFLLACLQIKNQNRVSEAFRQLKHQLRVENAEVQKVLTQLATEIGIVAAIDTNLFNNELPQTPKSPARPTEAHSHIKKPASTKSMKKFNEAKQSSDAVPQITSKDDYKKKAAQGSRYLLKHDYENAVTSYKQALDYTIVSDVDRPLLLYAHGTALKRLATKKDLGEALKTFNGIVDAQPVRAMSHLALGEVYYLQTQFDKSEEILRRGLMFWQEQKMLTWPGIETVIEESNGSKLKAALDKMITLCHHPPQPVARCRLPKTKSHLKVNIYIEDPEFKGFVRCTCFAKCVIEYHLDCWKKVNNELQRPLKKDLINAKCLTPDCNASIRSVTYYDKEGNEKRKIKSDKREEKPRSEQVLHVQKQVKCERNLRLWEKCKSARKEIRRLAREQRKKSMENEEGDRTEVDNASNSAQATGGIIENTVEQMLPPSGDIEQYAVVLRKDDPASDEAQVHRKKKKKEKSKKNVIMNLFGDQDDAGELEGEYSDLNSENWNTSDEYMFLSQNYDPPVNLFSGMSNVWVKPPEPAPTDTLTSANYTNPEPSPTDTLTSANYTNPELAASSETNSQTDNQTANQKTKEFLYSYFYNILEHHGPLRISDPLITEALEQFPEEILQLVDDAGGVGQFLSNNVQFDVVDDVVSLLQDRAKAFAMVQEQKRLMAEKYRHRLSQMLSSTSGRCKKKKSCRICGDMNTGQSPGDYNYLNEECLSEQSWPESDVSEMSKYSEPQDPALLTDSGHIQTNKVVTSTPLSSVVSTQTSHITSSTFLLPTHMIFQNAASCMSNSVLSMPTTMPGITVPSNNIENSTANSQWCGRSQTSQDSPLKSFNLPSELASVTDVDTLSADGWFDDKNIDDDQSVCSGFKELDQMDDGLEISNINTQLLDKAANIGSGQNTDQFNEPINIAVGELQVSRKKSRHVKKKSAARCGVVDAEKIKSKLASLRRQDDKVAMAVNNQQKPNEHQITVSSVHNLVNEEPRLVTAQLKTEIDHSESLRASSKDAAEKSTGYTVTVCDDNKSSIKTAELPQRRMLSEFDSLRRDLEKKLDEYTKVLKLCQAENTPVPPEITESFNKLKSRLWQLYQNVDTSVKHDSSNSLISPVNQQTLHEKSKTMSSFEKIVFELKNMFPDHEISDIKQHIMEFRQSCGGTLSGMKLSYIISQVASTMCSMNKISASHHLYESPAYLQEMWNPVESSKPSVSSDEVFDEQNPCVICLDQLTQSTELRIDCGHRFHNRCLREWLKRDRICPTCRQHILLNDEFPTL